VTFSNEYMEISHIREILTYEVLGASGITVGRATPIRVYFDIGDGKGPTFWGLHTMVEDPTDHIIKSLPGDKTPGLGHVYKPTISTWESLWLLILLGIVWPRVWLRRLARRVPKSCKN